MKDSADVLIPLYIPLGRIQQFFSEHKIQRAGNFNIIFFPDNQVYGMIGGFNNSRIIGKTLLVFGLISRQNQFTEKGLGSLYQFNIRSFDGLVTGFIQDPDTVF